MVVFAFWSQTRKSEEGGDKTQKDGSDEPVIDISESAQAQAPPEDGAPAADAENRQVIPEDVPLPASPPEVTTTLLSVPLSPVLTSTTTSDAPPEAGPQPPFRLAFSNRSFAFLYGKNTQHEKPTVISSERERDKKARAAAAFARRLTKSSGTKSEKRAKESALVVRSLIVGQSSVSPASARAVSKPQLNKVKTQLTVPKSANKIITQLRALPANDVPSDLDDEKKQQLLKPKGPIHAVCLQYPDAEANDRLFSRLDTAEQDAIQLARSVAFPSVVTASVASMVALFDDLHIVNLLTAPDLGFGQPGDGEGLLAGAVPTAETIITGIEQITPQLMALGYATGQAVTPDHSGIYPPTDRISVLTYWWGLEVCLPHPTLAYLSRTDSITHAVINFLTALSIVDGGIREILPFVRYISQFMDFEFKAIQAQDKGKGVVCAATWIMPAALVPRPWDFPDPPPPESAPSAGNEGGKAEEPPVEPPSKPSTQPPSVPSADTPNPAPPTDKPDSAPSDEPASSPKTPAEKPTPIVIQPAPEDTASPPPPGPVFSPPTPTITIQPAEESDASAAASSESVSLQAEPAAPTSVKAEPAESLSVQVQPGQSASDETSSS